MLRHPNVEYLVQQLKLMTYESLSQIRWQFDCSEDNSVSFLDWKVVGITHLTPNNQEAKSPTNHMRENYGNQFSSIIW